MRQQGGREEDTQEPEGSPHQRLCSWDIRDKSPARAVSGSSPGRAEEGRAEENGAAPLRLTGSQPSMAGCSLRSPRER